MEKVARAAHGLPRPQPGTWVYGAGLWTAEVWQSAYGHKARKRTWLVFCGSTSPFDMRWNREAGTHQIGGADGRGKAGNKPTLSGKAASATPKAFRDELLALARSAQWD